MGFNHDPKLLISPFWEVLQTAGPERGQHLQTRAVAHSGLHCGQTHRQLSAASVMKFTITSIHVSKSIEGHT